MHRQDVERERMVEGPSHLGDEFYRQARHVELNLSRASLYEQAVRRKEGLLADTGSLVVVTGEFTGRSPKDKYIVSDDSTSDRVWWGSVNQPLAESHFGGLYRRMKDYFRERDIFVQDLFACADPAYRLNLRVVTEHAWHSLFAQALFIRAGRRALDTFTPGLTVLQAPGFRADPAVDGTKSGTFIVLNLARRLLLVGGTGYAGEVKKSVFTALNYLLPEQGVLSMHCSANRGSRGDVALFFGLSGTGKTSLATVPERAIIGDDEHGWSDRGVFNFEGGLYAKVIRLSASAEPQIWLASNRFGSVLENVVVDPSTRSVDFDADDITENTRAAFPIDFVSNADPDGMGGHPSNIILLTADAFGVMPPVARLSHAQAMYHFLSGYTAKVAGTERGLTAQPEATFSPCFAAPFLALHPSVYARLLGQKIARHKVQCWLVNTGWVGGPYGVGKRISIAYSRAIVQAVLNGTLATAPVWSDPVFGFGVPEHCPGVPSEILSPRQVWGDAAAYDEQAIALARRFRSNFELLAEQVLPEVRQAGPLA